MSTDFEPHPVIHRPAMFICSMDDPDESIIGFRENEPADIAPMLLEEIGEWYQAIRGLQRTQVPPAVLEALGRLHEAVGGWTDFTQSQRPKP